MENTIIDLDNLPPEHEFSYSVYQMHNRMFCVCIYKNKKHFKKVNFHDVLSAFKYLVELEENK